MCAPSLTFSAAVILLSSAGLLAARLAHTAYHTMPNEPKPWKTEGQPAALMSAGDSASPAFASKRKWQMWWLWAVGEGAALQHVHVLHSIRACVPAPWSGVHQNNVKATPRCGTTLPHPQCCRQTCRCTPALESGYVRRPVPICRGRQ